jgi:hypothetical protein
MFDIAALQQAKTPALRPGFLVKKRISGDSKTAQRE